MVATGEMNGVAEIGQSISNGFSPNEQLQFGKNLDIWFMLMLVAFLMIFIRKFEWGVCLAVLLSAAGSFVIYLALATLVPVDGAVPYEVWDQSLLINAVICAITVVIAIGVFLGTCKMWQYFLVGVLFAFVYYVVQYYIMGSVCESIFGEFATDPGGSVLVHMCAAYFGLGVALGIREKRAFNEPMYTTTHSVTFVWLASMLLWMLWPSFVTSLLDPSQITWGTITCYMAGMGSLISTYIVCVAIQGKVNPLIYTYAMLCGPVAIGAPLLSVGPWGALLIGLIAGAVSALCFIYLQPWLCSKLGVLDVMGVHNLHGVGGWMGALFVSIVVGSFTTLGVAVLVFAFTLITGFVVGFIVKMTRGEMADEELIDDDVDFIKSEKPADA
ncbi:MAG: ammonium transporter [Candidatus Methanomethylophilaceae archaeon]|nr:ammonium transporter [Candidatus Methanomethylophilaceae archaeon]